MLLVILSCAKPCEEAVVQTTWEVGDVEISSGSTTVVGEQAVLTHKESEGLWRLTARAALTPSSACADHMNVAIAFVDEGASAALDVYPDSTGYRGEATPGLSATGTSGEFFEVDVALSVFHESCVGIPTSFPLAGSWTFDESRSSASPLETYCR